MKRILKGLSLLLILLFCLSGCGKDNKKNEFEFAVLGDENSFHEDYKLGIENAVKDLNLKEEESKIHFSVKFYNDKGDYNRSMQNVAAAIKDSDVKAIIGSDNTTANKTAIKMTDDKDIIFVSPHFLYDSIFQTGKYNKAFCTCFSAENVGRILRKAAHNSPADKWAVCINDNTFEIEEMRGFVFDNKDSVDILDCVEKDELLNNFAKIHERWELLGIEGVAIFTDEKSGFEIIKNLKRKNPSLILIGDTDFDNFEYISADRELTSYMKGFIMCDEFYFNNKDKKTERELTKTEEKILNDQNVELDTWYFQGYNAIKMIGDNAIKLKTINTDVIARELHKNGYLGLAQNYKFKITGLLDVVPDYYNIFTDDLSSEIVELR